MRTTLVSCLPLLAVIGLPLFAQRPVGGLTESAFKDQPYQKPQNCLPCHQRQFDEMRTSVKSGYRSVSPLFNGLETSGNFLNGGLLRPVYADSTKTTTDATGKVIPFNTNMFTTRDYVNVNQVRAGFCFSCHNGPIERNGDNPAAREVPELAGTGPNFVPELFRPLRDYHFVDASGNQVLPATIGGDPPPGATPSIGANAIHCDICHNIGGADLSRSLQADGIGNNSVLFNHTVEKVGPFLQPVAVKGDFHVASNNPEKIAFLRSSAFCNACHDVRVPTALPGDLQHFENDVNAGGQNVTYYRLENLSTEWQLGAYNSTNNPFGKVIRCQDCHMSNFPYGGNSTYTVGDLNITSPTPAQFFTNYAAVPGGVSTEQNFPLQQRKVVNHHFTGVDVPLLYTSELQARVDPTYPDAYQPGVDEYGIPLALAQRRQDLLDAAVRISLAKTDTTAKLGQIFTVRAECVALTGHRFPAGFSQERTGYIQLSVTDDNGFLLYQSGYVVDKPHPETGELQPDGNLSDEDNEHIHAVVDPGNHNRDPTKPYPNGSTANAGHTNQVFEAGPDDGSDARLFFGFNEGLVLFRNELTRIALPGQGIGRTDASGKAIVVTKPHYEETFSAALANTVDNFRSLQPLVPHTYSYDITLPTQAELAELGITSIKAPLHVHAQINYEHFPPLFVRFLIRTTGPNGPSGHDLGLLSEQRLDDLLKSLPALATADTTVNVQE
ncbi:MAG TPA: hypothetical protein VKG25_27800 [Bryobacteraceae bacterium]|nr:hypothetical protein [Bryobacteraceae bacterium]